jgi:hypothetical protein
MHLRFASDGLATAFTDLLKKVTTMLKVVAKHPYVWYYTMKCNANDIQSLDGAGFCKS